MSEDIFIKINKMRDLLNQNIINSKSDNNNIIKAKKIYDEIGIMLSIWTDDENMKTLSENDKNDILNTSKLIIKKANDLL
tara:strand:+ start:372 stop:611 length:240 start_codon:yes stop_codon:yes gene_type:complete